jgi:hypothetical protein
MSDTIEVRKFSIKYNEKVGDIGYAIINLIEFVNENEEMLTKWFEYAGAEMASHDLNVIRLLIDSVNAIKDSFTLKHELNQVEMMLIQTDAWDQDL